MHQRTGGASGIEPMVDLRLDRAGRFGKSTRTPASVQLDQRSVTVRPNREKVGDPAPPDGADHGQRPTFESMTLARDRDRIRSIMTLGSLWPRPSIRFRIPS